MKPIEFDLEYLGIAAIVLLVGAVALGYAGVYFCTH